MSLNKSKCCYSNKCLHFLRDTAWILRSKVQIIFPASYAGQKVLNKAPIVWLVGARPPLLSLSMKLTIIGLFHPLDGIANPKYTSLCFFKQLYLVWETRIAWIKSNYYWLYKCTACHHYTNIIKNGLIKLIKTRKYIYKMSKGLA